MLTLSNLSRIRYELSVIESEIADINYKTALNELRSRISSLIQDMLRDSLNEPAEGIFHE